jgi:hypothetical protein
VIGKRQPGGGIEKRFHLAGFLSARKKMHIKNITKQHLVLCFYEFSNINNFVSNTDILKN